MAAPTIAAGLRQLLTAHVPFSAMSAADVDYVIQNVEIAYFGPDEIVLAPSGSVPTHCHIVKQDGCRAMRRTPKAWPTRQAWETASRWERCWPSDR